MFKHLYFSFVEYLLIFKKWIEKYSLKNPPITWGQGSQGKVILIPGFQETWVSLSTIANLLNNQGYKIFVVKEISPSIIPVGEMVEKVKIFILKNKINEVILLSHSKGGIVCRFILADKKFNSRIKYSINIATPNNGTLFGHLRFHNLKELTPNSKLFKELESKEQNYNKIINIYPKLDNHTIPNSSLYLKGAKNIQIDIVGHTRILESDKTIEVIRKILN